MQVKSAIFLLFLLAFSACKEAVQTPQAPSWYVHHTFKEKKSSEYLGYGEGESLFAAKALAKEAIAQTLMSLAESSSVIQSEVRKKNGVEVVNKRAAFDLKITTKINLQNLEVKKQEQQNGRYYVVLAYQNLDLVYRLKKSVGDVECGKVDSYMTQTPLYAKIRSALSCDVSLQLERKNSAWYLAYKEHTFLLGDGEFEKLYVSKQSKKFDFSISKSVLRDGDSFYLSLRAKKAGYITLLDVYENGVVTLLQDSKKIDEKMQIPSKESKNYFEAGVLEKGRDSHDLYVAIYSQTPLDMSRFVYGDEELESDESAYKFDELIKLLNSYEYATLLVRTKI